MLPAKDLESLHEIWRFEIIPLLQEYFYGDGEKLHELLGTYFVDRKDIDFGEGGETSGVFRIKKTTADQGFVDALKKIAS